MRTSVLVVDDDATFRKLARRMLESAGLNVIGEAGTVADGAAAAAELRPQAALVDVALPDGSGVELAMQLAALSWRPRIVLTSSDPGAATDTLARSVGAAAFVAKRDLSGRRLHALLGGPAPDRA
jgi:DNA-binding NarL/FixJ family response regulator